MQFLQYLPHLLKGGDACGHQWQTQAVFNHAHGIEHGFYTGRIAVHKEEAEQLCKAMVNLQRVGIVALQSQTGHAAELLGECITDNRDNTYGT